MLPVSVWCHCRSVIYDTERQSEMLRLFGRRYLSPSTPTQRRILDDVAWTKRGRGQADAEILRISYVAHRVGSQDCRWSAVHAIPHFHPIAGISRRDGDGNGSLCTRRNRLIARTLSRLKPEGHAFPVITHDPSPVRGWPTPVIQPRHAVSPGQRLSVTQRLPARRSVALFAQRLEGTRPFSHQRIPCKRLPEPRASRYRH